MDHPGRKETAQLYAPVAPTIHNDTVFHFLCGGIALAVLPVLFYLVIFCLYTYPLVLDF